MTYNNPCLSLFCYIQIVTFMFSDNAITESTSPKPRFHCCTIKSENSKIGAEHNSCGNIFLCYNLRKGLFVPPWKITVSVRCIFPCWIISMINSCFLCRMSKEECSKFKSHIRYKKDTA